MKRIDRAMLAPDAQTGVPLTTRGDLAVSDGSAVVRLPVGSDGQALVADSTQAAGVKWGAAAGGGAAGRVVGEIGLFARPSTPSGWLPCDGSSVSQSTYAALYAALGGDASPYGHDATTFRVPDLRGRMAMGAGTGSYSASVGAVDTGTGRLTIPAGDSIRTGTAVVYTSAGDVAAPLVSGTTYYAILDDATHVRLASSRAAAVAGAALALTSAGSGVQALTVALAARSVGAVGGEEAHTLTIAEIPSHTHAQGKDTATGSIQGSDPGGYSNGATGPTGGSGAHATLPPYGVLLACVYAGV